MLRYSLLFLFFSAVIFAQDAKNYSIMIETQLDFSGKAPAIDISWQNDVLATKYIISRRELEQGSFEKVTELSGAASRFYDLNIEIGKIYEYEVEKIFSYDNELISTKAYKAISWDVDLTEKNIRTLLILLDYSKAKKVEANLTNYINTLEKEGWNVIVKNSPRIESFNPKAVVSVKNMIKTIYKVEDNLESVLILGRVAIPYSGNYAPDGHGDGDIVAHKGAYPTDSYYADINQANWTDTSEVNENSSFERQYNNINDGKWDQSFIPGEVELSVGRVDFFDLPFFEESEEELINSYLERNIEYRLGKLEAENFAILHDGFADWKQGFAADGWNNLSALYGRDGINEMSVYEELREKSYKMVYACASGSFDNIYQAIYAIDLADYDYLGIHNIVFGSYNCDWDSQNNLMRSIIASKPMGLTAIWGTRPFWTYYKLGLGQTFGDALKSTQNNRKEYKYPSVAYNGGVHIALMGDPTLKLININVIKTCGFLYENDEVYGLSIRLLDEFTIFGYQLLMRQKETKRYEIVIVEQYQEGRTGEFIIPVNNIQNLDQFELESMIIRPIIRVENHSGIFKYCGIGKRAN